MSDITYEEYEEYEEIRKKIIEDPMNNAYFTKDYFDKLQEQIKKEEEFESKIDNLAKEYFEIIKKSFSIEDIKDFNYAVLGYYSILEYCLKQIKLNDKNLLHGFCANLGNGQG